MSHPSALLGVVVLCALWLPSCGDDGDTRSDARSASVDAGTDAPGSHDASPDAGGPPDAAAPDAPPSLAPASLLACEVTEPPGPIPDPPTTRVADLGLRCASRSTTLARRTRSRSRPTADWVPGF